MSSLAFCAAAEGGERADYFAPANILRFADHLYTSGDYLRAAGEYHRYLFYAPQDAQRVLYSIGRCYQLAGKSEQALEIFARLIAGSDDGFFIAELRYELSRTYFLMEYYDKSLACIDETLAKTPHLPYQWQLYQLKGFNYLKQRRWAEAEELFDSLAVVAAGVPLAQQARLFAGYAVEGRRLPRKNVALAGVLSAVVPGLGKAYAGRPHDGAFALFTVGFMGWLAWDGFQDDGRQSLKGWIFAPLAGVFHLGNIYGAVLAARLHNRHAEREFISRIPFAAAPSAGTEQ